MSITSNNLPVSGQGGFQDFNDAELVQEITRRAARERHATADMIRVLGEFDRRELYLSQGFASLFAYCTGALNYSEYAAFNRIEVARAAARWPQLLAAIEDGSLHLTGARLLAPHLTEDNIDDAIASARHKSKRHIEEIAAGLAQRSMLVAVDAPQYRLHLTISRAALDMLRQVQALMAHQLPPRSDALIFEKALALLLQKLERQRFGATDRPRVLPAEEPVASVPERHEESASRRPEDTASAGARSRHIPAAVGRAVWKRDEARCAFVGMQGRCSERSRLEFHHVVPFAAGGRSTSSNIELRCRAHNAYEAKVYFGAEVVAAAREARRSGMSSPGGVNDPNVGPGYRATEINPADDTKSVPPEKGGQGRTMGKV